jgi:uncharacterized protein (TIGR00288 family)
MSEHALAVLVDFENMARPGARSRGEFDIHLILNRLAEKGRVVVKRAYADWSRYRDARRELQSAGLELIEMPSAREGAKNRADIKMAVDAMEIAYSREHVDNFVIVSGDSDFTPLVGKLRELNKRVIGVGRDQSSASQLLIANCDEFIFYDNLRSLSIAHHHDHGTRPDPLTLLRETLVARMREGDERPQASAVKDSMRRRDPAFDESELGFSAFSKFLEDAQVKGVVRLEMDPRSGTYLVEPAELSAGAPPQPTEDRPIEISEGRRRRRRRRTDQQAPTADAAEAGDGAEVFEFEVRQRPPAAAELPPLDEPITYEDIVLSTDADLDAEPQDLVEATDVEAEEAEEEEPRPSARRRRRRLSSAPEPTPEELEAAADLGGGAAATTEPAPEPEPEPAPEPAAEPAPAPSSRRRVRRGTVAIAGLGETAPAAEEAAPAAEEAPPKPKRRTRKKAEEPAPEPVAEEAAPAEPPAEEAAPKPRRRTRKKAEEPVAEEAAAEAPAEEAAPKPRRRTRKKAEEPAPTA